MAGDSKSDSRSPVRELIDRLGVTVVGPDDTAPHVTGRPFPDPHATARLVAAVAPLREDLQRNDPGTARELAGSWEELAGLLVRVELGLTCAVTLPGRATLVHFPVETPIDTGQGVMYVRSTSVLARVSHAGRTQAASAPVGVKWRTHGSQPGNAPRPVCPRSTSPGRRTASSPD